MKTPVDAAEILRNSEKFRYWRRFEGGINKDGLFILCDMAEKHYAPDELAELWGVSSETIRSIFRDEEGVLKIGKTGAKYKRGYVTLRIPESVAERIHKRLSA